MRIVGNCSRAGTVLTDFSHFGTSYNSLSLSLDDENDVCAKQERGVLRGFATPVRNCPC